MANRLVGGIAYVKVNGQQYALKGNLTYSPGTLERETVLGMDGIHGYKQTPKAPMVEMDLTDSPELDMKTFEEMTDVTVTVELGNGKQFVLSNAWCTMAPEIDATEGQGTVKFEGLKGEVITSAAA